MWCWPDSRRSCRRRSLCTRCSPQRLGSSLYRTKCTWSVPATANKTPPHTVGRRPSRSGLCRNLPSNWSTRCSSPSWKSSRRNRAGRKSPVWTLGTTPLHNRCTRPVWSSSKTCPPGSRSSPVGRSGSGRFPPGTEDTAPRWSKERTRLGRTACTILRRRWKHDRPSRLCRLRRPLRIGNFQKDRRRTVFV